MTDIDLDYQSVTTEVLGYAAAEPDPRYHAELPPAFDRTRVITVTVISGGGTKTTTAVNVAAMAAARGYRVGVIDLDQQANATEILGHYDYAGPTVYDAMQGDVQLADIMVPARYLKGEDPRSEDPDDFTVIPRLWVAPGDEQMRNADVDMSSRQSEGFTVEWLRMQVPDLSAKFKLDAVFIDNPASASLLVVSGIAAATEVAASMRSEFKELKGVGAMDKMITKVRSTKRWDQGQEITAVVVGDVPPSNMGNVYKDAMTAAKAQYEDLIMPPVRHSSKVPESYAWATALMYWAPKEGVTQDYWKVTDKMGFPQREGIVLVQPDGAKAAAYEASR
jgi:chromosome partitioning protein